MKRISAFILSALVMILMASAAMAADPVAAGFTRYEGESGTIVGSNSPATDVPGTETGDQYSGGRAASHLDVMRCSFEELDAAFSKAAHVEIKVNAASAGTAEAVIGYVSSSDAEVIAVKAAGDVIRVPIDASGKATVTLNLVKGENTVYISTTMIENGAHKGWINIDYLDVSNTITPAASAEPGDGGSAPDATPATGESAAVYAAAIVGAIALAGGVVLNRVSRKARA